MGYTHYINFNFKKMHGKTQDLETKYQKALKHINSMVYKHNKNLKKVDPKHHARLSGYTAHSKNYGGIDFNGTGKLGHENFYLREHLSENASFMFCKTARKPYDALVVASLIILKRYLGEYIEVSSDGYSSDWLDGLHLAQVYTGLKTLKIPSSIEVRLEVVS